MPYPTTARGLKVCFQFSCSISIAKTQQIIPCLENDIQGRARLWDMPLEFFSPAILRWRFRRPPRRRSLRRYQRLSDWTTRTTESASFLCWACTQFSKCGWELVLVGPIHTVPDEFSTGWNFSNGCSYGIVQYFRSVHTEHLSVVLPSVHAQSATLRNTKWGASMAFSHGVYSQNGVKKEKG